MKSILLVDDSDTILTSMSGILGRAGFRTETASDGRAALTKLGSFKADLVITDLNMPGMDGIGLIREIRKMGGYRFTPILMLTTESHQAKRVEAKSAGATGWIVKPVAGEDLLSVVKKVLPGG